MCKICAILFISLQILHSLKHLLKEMSFPFASYFYKRHHLTLSIITDILGFIYFILFYVHYIIFSSVLVLESLSQHFPLSIMEDLYSSILLYLASISWNSNIYIYKPLYSVLYEKKIPTISMPIFSVSLVYFTF